MKKLKRPPKKATHGGAREGSGAPAKSKQERVTVTRQIRMSKADKKDFDAHLGAENKKRAKIGWPPLSFSAWARRALRAEVDLDSGV